MVCSMTLAQKYFGDMYAGFDILLRNIRNFHIETHEDVERCKWIVLQEVHASKPVTFNEAANIITEITDVKYPLEQLYEFVRQYNESLEP